MLQVLLHHFGGSRHCGAGHEVLYPRDPPNALRVLFNQRGEPTAAYAGEALTPDARLALLEPINWEFIASAGVGVNRQVYFSMAPVRGWWRYRDRFLRMTGQTLCRFTFASAVFTASTFPNCRVQLVWIARHLRYRIGTALCSGAAVSADAR
jgi:hypothetical protein